MTKVYSPVGVDLTKTSSAALFGVGDCAYGEDNSAWIYVKADGDGVTGSGYVVLLDRSYNADMIDTTNSASAFGQRVAVSMAGPGANEYFWAQIRGAASVRVAASAAANATLNSTGTAGQLADDGSTGAEAIDGLVLTTANGGSAGTAEAVLNDPTVGATL